MARGASRARSAPLLGLSAVLALALAGRSASAQGRPGPEIEVTEDDEDDLPEGDPTPAPPGPDALAPGPAPVRPFGAPPEDRPAPPRERLRPLDLPPVAPGPALVTEEALKRHLEARARAVRAGDARLAEVELSLLEEARGALGARNVVLASAALIAEARQAIAANRPERAEALAEAAARLSPDLPAAHWARARAYLATDSARLGAAFAAAADLVVAKVTRFRNLVGLLSDVVVLAAVALLATMVIFTLVQLTKYLRYPAHDLAALGPRFIGPGEVASTIVVLLALPLTFDVGIVPTLAMALGLILAYQRPRERAVSLVLMALLAASPFLLRAGAPLVTYHGSEVDVMATAVSEALAEEGEERLRALSTQRGNDYGSAVILAYRMRQRGDLAGAAQAYRRALAARPSDALAKNNLGAVLWRQGKEDQALALFQSAAQTRTLAEPILNLATSVADLGRYEEANRLLEQGRALNPELTARYTGADAGVGSRRNVLEAPLGEELLWDHFFRVSATQAEAVTLELWRPLGGAVPPFAMTAVVLLCAGLGGLLFRRASSLSVPCPKCARPAVRGAPSQFCGQCHSVFLTAVAVDPSVRMAKENQVRGYQRRRRLTERLLSLLAGAGHVFGDRPIAGVLLLFLFTTAVAVALFPHGLTNHAWDVVVDISGPSLLAVVAAGLAGLLSIFALRRVMAR